MFVKTVKTKAVLGYLCLHLMHLIKKNDLLYNYN